MSHKGPTNWSTRDPAGLSYQERRVLELLRKGASTAEIRKHMGLSRNSAYTYVMRVLRKTHTHSRQEVVAVIPHWSPGASLDDEIDLVADRGSH